MPLAQCGSGTGNAIQLCCHCRDPQGAEKINMNWIRKRACCGWTASSTPPTHYPANYGMIPLTYADDHDPLDVLILCQEPLVPMCMVTCRPIGLMTMVDDNERDEKIIAVPVSDPAMEGYSELHHPPPHHTEEMQHFFEVYKTLEGKKTVVEGFEGRKAAEQAIARSLEAYKKEFGLEG